MSLYMEPTVSNLKLFCKQEKIKKYSKLNKVQLLQLLHDLGYANLVSHCLENVPTNELISYYLVLSDCSFKTRVTDQLQWMSSSEWDTVSESSRLTNDFIVNFQTLLNWDILSSNECLTEDFIIQFQTLLNWDILSSNECLTENIIKLCVDYVNFFEMSKRSDIPESILRQFWNRFDHRYLYHTQQFSESFMKDFIGDLLPCGLLQYQRLSEEFLRTHLEYLFYGKNSCRENLWSLVAEFQVLSDRFILDYKLELPWPVVCKHQTLSTEVLVELQNVVATYYGGDTKFWDLISMHQDLSIDFLHQFKDKVNWKTIVIYRKLSLDVIKTFIDKMKPSYLKLFQNLPPEFVELYMLPYRRLAKTIMCSVCLEDVENGIETIPCHHLFCKTCIDRCLEIKPNCPLCRENLSN